MLEKDEVLARTASTSSTEKLCGITGAPSRSFMRRSMCEADTSRSFSNICTTNVAETRDKVTTPTHDERSAALTFNFFSPSDTRITVYVVHLAPDGTSII